MNTAAVDLPDDYTNLSYARQGLPIEPQPKLVQAVVAIERQGFFTRKGNALRDILMPSTVYENLHPDDMAAQREGAVMDVVREAAKQSVTVGVEVADGNDEEARSRSVEHPPAPMKDPVLAAAGDVGPGATNVPKGWASAPPRPSQMPEHASLMAKFEAALPIVPVTTEAKETFFGLLKLSRQSNVPCVRCRT
jgi:hypothetical protein